MRGDGYDETLFQEAGWEWAELGENSVRTWCDTDGPHCINGTGAWQNMDQTDKFLCARCLDHYLTPDALPAGTGAKKPNALKHHESAWDIAERLQIEYERCGHLVTEKCEHWVAVERARLAACKADPSIVGLVPVVVLSKPTGSQLDRIKVELTRWQRDGGGITVLADCRVEWVPDPSKKPKTQDAEPEQEHFDPPARHPSHRRGWGARFTL